MAKPDDTFYKRVSENPYDFCTRDGKEVFSVSWHPKHTQPLRVGIRWGESAWQQSNICVNADGTFRHDGTESNLDIVSTPPHLDLPL